VDFPDPVRPITAMKMSSALRRALDHGRCDGRSCDQTYLKAAIFSPPLFNLIIDVSTVAWFECTKNYELAIRRINFQAIKRGGGVQGSFARPMLNTSTYLCSMFLMLGGGSFMDQ